jgi:hypothetical protein
VHRPPVDQVSVAGKSCRVRRVSRVPVPLRPYPATNHKRAAGALSRVCEARSPAITSHVLPAAARRHAALAVDALVRVPPRMPEGSGRAPTGVQLPMQGSAYGAGM